jgi:hypothetical protein
MFQGPGAHSLSDHAVTALAGQENRAPARHHSLAAAAPISLHDFCAQYLNNSHWLQCMQQQSNSSLLSLVASVIYLNKLLIAVVKVHGRAVAKGGIAQPLRERAPIGCREDAEPF